MACEPDPHFEETLFGKLFLSGSCFYGKPFFWKSFYGKPFYGKTVWGQLLFGEGIGNELLGFRKLPLTHLFSCVKRFRLSSLRSPKLPPVPLPAPPMCHFRSFLRRESWQVRSPCPG